MITTDYFFDFVQYYDRAKRLQEMNISSPTGRDVDEDPGFYDPLMQYVTIYDCVDRRLAGFSNALQQVFLGSDNPKRWQADPYFDGWRDWATTKAQMWLCLWHRVTGSGASFSHDHGFRNSKVALLARSCPDLETMKAESLRLLYSKEPCFTSIGNQIPPFPKPRQLIDDKGSQRYFDEYACQLVSHVCAVLHKNLNYMERGPLTIPEVVREIELWCRQRKLKVFRFVYTAWAMDLATYWPHLVDPKSHVHYGKNALESLGLMFDGFTPKLVDRAMERIMDVTGNDEPMSLEDVLCDYVRYIERYVPKGYEHLEPWQVQNTSSVKHPVRHPSYLKIMEKVRD
jgi:hypothetical protein